MRFKLCFSCLFFIALVLQATAQDKGNTIELKTILISISEKENIVFNYLENEIAVFKIIPPNPNLNLKEKLDYISKTTHLKFYFITENYISIVLDQKQKKVLCGYLIDSQTNEKIENASINYISTTIFTVSDEKGYFELPYNSSYSIEISHLGYKKTVLETNKFKENDCIEVVLNPNSSQLNEVIAEVYLTKGISKKIDGSFEIQPKKFSILPGLTEPDVFQTMKQLPGISSIDETVSNINTRGGSHDQNLFIYNDIRLFQTGHFYGLISVLNPNLPNKINIIKNGTSAFYGESVSSTVTISTDSTTEKRSSIGLNLLNIDFNTHFTIADKSSLAISGRRSYTDFFRSPTYTNYFQRVFQNTIVTNFSDNQNIAFNTNENFYFYDATLQFNQKIKEKSSLQVNFITISNQLDLNQSKEENNNTIVKNSTLGQKSLGGSLIFKTDWNSKNTSKLILYGSFYKIDSKNESIIGNQIFTQENAILDTGIRIENSHILNAQFTFKNGYQFNEIGIQNFDKVNTPSFSRKTKEVLHNHALITEIEYLSNNQKFNSSFGIRHNYISQFNTFIFEPRLRINYQLSNFFSTQFLAEKKHQTSSQIIDLQQDFLGVEKRRWILVNNEDIPIVSSNQIALGITFKKRNWLFSMDNFYKKVEGITSKSQGFQNQLEFEKIIGEYTTIGSELLVQKQIKNFTSWISYTISKNNYTFDFFVPKKFPNNFDIQHNIGLGIIYNFNPLKIALGSKWFTGRPTTLPLNNSIEDNSIVYNNPNSDRLPNYFQTNISAGYTFSFKDLYKLQIGVSIQNAFNTKNILNQYFRINQNTNSIEKVTIYSLELTPNAYVRYSF